MKIQHVPLDLHLFIASFLNYDERISFGSCCVKFYEDILKDNLRYFVVKAKSKFFQQYKTDESIRERFEKALHHPGRSLKLLYPSIDDLEDFPLTEVYHLFTNCDNFHNFFSHKFHKIHSLTVYNTTPPMNPLLLKEDNDFYQLKALNLFFPTSTAFELPPLPPSVNHLLLRGMFSNITNETFQRFYNLQKLDLTKIDGLTDVSMLGNIPFLRIVNCNNLIDITPLQNNRTVVIKDCVSIKDYRNAFTYCQKIWITLPSLEHYNLPKDSVVCIEFNQLNRIETLALDSKNYFPFAQLSKNLPVSLRKLRLTRMLDDYDRYKFDQLFQLELAHSPTFWNTRLLGRIPRLTLINLSGIKALHGIGYDEDSSKNLRNRVITVVELDYLKNFSPLNTVPRVTISQCKSFKDLRQVKNVKNLTIFYCPKIKKIKVNIHSESLTLKGLIEEIFFDHLHVKDLDISALITSEEGKNLMGLEKVKGLRRVTISSVWKEGESKAWKMLEQDYMKQGQATNVVYVRKNIAQLKIEDEETNYTDEDEEVAKK